MSDAPAIHKPVAAAKAAFFLPLEEADLFAPLDALPNLLSDTLKEISQAFRYNLSSVAETMAIPLTFASSSVHHSHFQRFHSAERIRALPEDDFDDKRPATLSPESERRALDIARTRSTEFANSAAGKERIARDTCEFLAHLLDSRELKGAAEELLRQGAVLVWGTLEVLVRDVFVAYLNSNPMGAIRLTQDVGTRKRFELKALPIDVLQDCNFDLSRRMGDILLANNDVGDLATIKDVYGVLFPEHANLRAALDERDLWVLSQRRHLIVHRRAVIDATYLKHTGESLPVGSRLAVTPGDLERYLRIVVRVASELLAASGSKFA